MSNQQRLRRYQPFNLTQVNSEAIVDGTLYVLPGEESKMNRTILVVLTAVAATLVTTVAAADGKTVWDKSCAGCHTVMAPKTGDKAAWAPFIKKGAAEMTAIVIKGKAPMPVRGGAASDADAKAAVEYIISQMQ
jgi:cytochrome c5